MPYMRLSSGRLSMDGIVRAVALVLGALLLGAATSDREFELSIVARRIEGTPSTIRVKRGEAVVLRWRTDEPVSLHVHGYDIQARVSPGAATRMRFEATVAGRFAITAHEFGAVAEHQTPAQKHREITLLYLEVLPE